MGVSGSGEIGGGCLYVVQRGAVWSGWEGHKPVAMVYEFIKSVNQSRNRRNRKTTKRDSLSMLY